jgi:eukaryotic-like serine/threonine-protein kinase
MAPELFGNDAYDEKVDVWACGVIMYQLLTGHEPFTGRNMNQLKSNVRHEEPDFSNHWL